jgi:hypothetical protein
MAEPMIPPDLAFALLINRTTVYYQSHVPQYMTYSERTHVSAPSLGRAQDINRSVAVRVADNFAVMRDLPNGGERTGQAFPILSYFDPLSEFQFSYFANLKRVDITIVRGRPYTFTIPAPDPSVDMVVPYNSYWDARYAPDSTESAIHLTIDPTARLTGFYPSDIVEDSASQLPSHIEMRLTGGDDEHISLDYKIIDGYWVITHGVFSATEHAVFMTFKVVADITFDNITFSQTAPDPRLAGTPIPATPTPAASPLPSSGGGG